MGGSATITGTGTSQVTINQTSERAVINWNSFSIGSTETTTFKQPDAGAVTLNRVTGNTPSAIFGALNANGTVIIENQNGILFGSGSKVNAGGLVATTHDVDNDGFMAGGPLHFQASPNEAANASVINKGTITVADEGLVALVAPHVRNSGIINANLGRVTLGAAQGFTLDLYGDNLVSFSLGNAITQTLMTANGKPLKSLVENNGAINAAGGTITLTAAQARSVVNQAVNTKGTLIADSVTQHGGTIILSSSDGNGNATGAIHASGLISANGATTGGTVQMLADKVVLKNATVRANGSSGGGTVRIGGGQHGGEGLMQASQTTANAGTTISADATGNGDGGSIVLWSQKVTRDYAFLSAQGGAEGGNGGNAEASSAGLLDFEGTVKLLSAKGSAGTLLLDPENVSIQNSGTETDSCSGGTYTPTGDPTSILLVSTLQTALANGNVTVSTGSTGSQTGNITVGDGTATTLTWNNGNLLTLSAAGNITISSNATISNTYTGSTFGASLTGGTFGSTSCSAGAPCALPVVLAMRADNASANGETTAAGSSYGFTNNGVIDMSGSSGAVSTFYDWNGAYSLGTLGTNYKTNSSWAAPTNLSVSSQFTGYRLLNSVSDLTFIGASATTLGYTYALGKNINPGSPTAFNSNIPIGNYTNNFTGMLDGQWCALAGGSACGISNLSLTTNSTQAGVGFISNNTGTLRNFSFNFTLSQTNTSSGGSIGGLAGKNAGTIANVSDNVSVTAAGTIVGGLVGLNDGNSLNAIIVNSSSSGTVSGASTVGGLVGLSRQSSGTAQITGSSSSVSVTSAGTLDGGLIGQTISTTIANNIVSNSFATGSVSGTGTVGGLIGSSSSALSNSYATGPVTGTLTLLGGLVGQNNATISGSYATGSVGGGTSNIGGLVGFNNGDTLVGTSIMNSYATGAVSGTASNIGGLVGINRASTSGTTSITNSYATGSVAGTGGSSSNVGGLVGTNQQGGTGTATISNSYATGSVTANNTAGGLVGLNSGASVSNSYATGYTTAVGTSVGGIAGNNTGNITNAYWDGGSGANTGTTGQSASSGSGATRDTTATLQSALPTGFSSSTWGIVAGSSYPYLLWQAASGTPQVVSGFAYSDRGTTTMANTNVGILINGGTAGSLFGGAQNTGANGYYYFLLAPNTLAAPGTNVLTYLTGATKGDAFYDKATASVPSFNIYGNELRVTSAGSTLSGITADLATALGANSGGNFLFTLSSGNLTATNNDNLDFITSASSLNLDKTLTASGTGSVIFTDGNAVTQNAAISSPNLLLLGGGSYTLTNSSNNIGTLAGNTGVISLTDSSSLIVGSVAGTTGLTASGAVTLMTTGTTSDITLASGSSITSSATGTAITLESARNFVNNAGSSALLASSGRWLVYSSTPGADSFGNLNSNNVAIWNTANGATVSQSGNRYVFVYQPTLTFTTTSDTKTYGVNSASAISGDYTVSGLQAAVTDAYLADTNATAFSGAPSITSAGSAVSASVAGGPYAITAAVGTLSSADGYAFAYTSTGTLTVNRANLTITADDKTMTYGGTIPTLTASYSGFAGADTAASLTTAPTLVSAIPANTNVGTYANTLTASGAVDNNYNIFYARGTLTITSRPVVPVVTQPSLAQLAQNNYANATNFLNFYPANVAAISMTAFPQNPTGQPAQDMYVLPFPADFISRD